MAKDFFGNPADRYIKCMTPAELAKAVNESMSKEAALKVLFGQLISFGYENAITAYNNWEAADPEPDVIQVSMAQSDKED